MTALTPAIYEAEFGGDIIKDIFGKLTLEDAQADANKVLDFTTENWGVMQKAFWAMLRTASEIAAFDGREHEDVPHFRQWLLSQRGTFDMNVIDATVVNEGLSTFFPSIAKAIEEV